MSWKVYTGAGLGEYDNVLTYFSAYQTNPELAARAFKPVYPNDFLADLANGELPQVCWINASLDQTEHPGYSTATAGEYTVAKLIKRLHTHHVWEKTALFLTWDENGGFFDHVAPPVAPPGTAGEYLTVPDVTGDADGITGPIGLGFRVPMMIVSPFSRGGFLCSDVFDHTSILRFLEARFGAEVPNLSEWRREVTGDLTSAFQLHQARQQQRRTSQGRVQRQGRQQRRMLGVKPGDGAPQRLSRTATRGPLAPAERALAPGARQLGFAREHAIDLDGFAGARVGVDDDDGGRPSKPRARLGHADVLAGAL